MCFLTCISLCLFNHAFHDLTLQEDGNASHVRGLNHPFLGKHQFLGGKLVRELISEDDNTIGVLENAFKLMDSFQVINLGEDSKSGAGVSSCVLDLLDIFD